MIFQPPSPSPFSVKNMSAHLPQHSQWKLVVAASVILGAQWQWGLNITNMQWKCVLTRRASILGIGSGSMRDPHLLCYISMTSFEMIDD